MPDFKGTTRAQTIFLRKFVKHPGGPPASEWPSPVVLRRWLKRRGFCGAMNSILRSMRYTADFHLTAAAASGANLLHSSVDSGDPAEARKQIESLIALLRMSHIRHRFAEPLPRPRPRGTDIIAVLRQCHPNAKVGEALALFDQLLSKVDGKETNECKSAWIRSGHSYDKPEQS